MRKIFGLLFAMVLLISFVGCSKDKNSKVENDTGLEKLVLVTNAEFPPYEYKEGNEFKGIDIELGEAIAKKLNRKLEVLDVEFDSIILALVNGKADMAIAGFTITEDRKSSVDFTDTYAKAVQSVIVKSGSDIKSIEDLNNKKIGVQTSTTGDIYCSKDFGEANVQRFSKHVDAIAALKANKVDAVVLDNAPAKIFVAENKDLVMLGTDYAEEEYAIAVKKSKDEFREQINSALKELKENGELQDIIDKYIN